MIQEAWTSILSSYGAYFGGSAVFALTLAGLLYVFVMEQGKEQRCYLFWYPFCTLVFIFCPVIILVMSFTIHETDTYWRMFWMYPAGMILAYCGTKLVVQVKGRWKQGVVLISTMVILMLAGEYVGQGDNYTRVHNPYKLPDEVVEIGEILDGLENVYAVGPEEVVCIIRLYSADIHTLYGRNLYRGWVAEEDVLELSEIIDDADINAAHAVEIAKNYGVTHIVIRSESKEAYDHLKASVDYLGGNEYYSVYAIK